jgi:hypothetical protein
VADQLVANGTVTGLSCAFPGGSTGVTWAGPFAPGASFDCTAHLADVAAGAAHEDIGSVTATGANSGTDVSDDNPYYGTADNPVQLGDYVWIDADHDGTQDADEAGVPGVRLTVTDTDGHPVNDAAGQPVAPTTTGPDGKYQFTGLPAGRYVTHIDYSTVPAGFVPTTPGAGTGEVDSSTDSATSAVLNPGEQDQTLDYGLWQPAPAISIVKGDVNGNAADTASEKVSLPDGSVRLKYTITNTGDEALADVTVTDQLIANGTVTGLSCVFPDASTGTTYTGILAVGASFDCTARLAGVVAGSDHHDVGHVAGVGAESGTPVVDDNPYYADLTPRVTIGDYVWIDVNHNGVQEQGEKGVPGVKITVTTPDGKPVTDVNGKPVGPATTDGSGLYHFVDLPPGRYVTHIDYDTVPDGLSPTTPGRGARGSDSSTGSATSQLLAGGQSDETLDYGLWTPGPAVAIVKQDAKGNDADSSDTAVTLADGSTGLVYTVTNNGDEPLTGVKVSDKLVTGGSVTGLSCVFGDKSIGTSWDGPFAPAASFTCTASLAGVEAGAEHEDLGVVAAVGTLSKTPVGATNPYYAQRPAAVAVDAPTGVDTGSASGHRLSPVLQVGGYTLLGLAGLLSLLALAARAARRRN